MSCCSTPANAPTAGAVAQVRGFGSPVAMSRNTGLSGAVAQVRDGGFGAAVADLRGFGSPVAQGRGFGAAVAQPRSANFGSGIECWPWDDNCKSHGSDGRTQFITSEYYVKWKVPICANILAAINNSGDVGSDSLRASIAKWPPSECAANAPTVNPGSTQDQAKAQIAGGGAPAIGSPAPGSPGSTSWFNPGGTSSGIVPGGGFGLPPPSFLSTLPPWALPTAIAAGVLTIGGIVLALTRKRRTA